MRSTTNYQSPEFNPALFEPVPMAPIRDAQSLHSLEIGTAVTRVESFADMDSLQRAATYTLFLTAEAGNVPRPGLAERAAADTRALRFTPPSLANLVRPAGITAARITSGVGYVLPFDLDRTVGSYVNSNEQKRPVQGLTLYIVGRLGVQDQVSKPFFQEVSYVMRVPRNPASQMPVRRYAVHNFSLVEAATDMAAITRQRVQGRQTPVSHIIPSRKSRRY